MYAIIETGGKQYTVKPGDVLDLERLQPGEAETIEFDKVLAISDDNGIHFGAPHLAGATVSGELVEQFRGKKVIVFKMKHRKGYRRKHGHRQRLSRVRILEITPAAAD